MRILVSKDRHGHVRQFAHGGKVGTFHLNTRPSHEGPAVYITAAAGAPDAPQPVPMSVNERIAAWLRDNPGANKTTIRGAGLGKTQKVDEALHELVESGRVTVENGSRGARLHAHWIESKPTDRGRTT